MAGQGIVHGLEGAYAEMVDWTVKAANEMAEEIGPRPFGLDSVPERVQAKHGALIYNDPQAWTILLQSHGWQPGGPLPRAVIEYGQRLVRLAAKYPDEFVEGTKAAEMARMMELRQEATSLQQGEANG